MTLKRTDSNNKDFRRLTGLLDLDLNVRYGDIQAQYHAFNVVESINTVVVAYCVILLLLGAVVSSRLT